MPAVVADGVGNVESEIIASLHSRHTEQLPVLRFAEMLRKIGVKSGTARQMFDVLSPVETELVDEVEGFVFYHIEITVVAVAPYFITVLTVPFGMLHANIFSRYHLAVEQNIF